MEQNGGASATSGTSATAENQVEDSGAGNIKIKVSYGSNNFDVFISPQSTFAKETGLEPEVQNLLFRGKEKDEQETLHMAGVKDNAKVILMENAPIKEEVVERVEEIKESIEPIKEISTGVEAVSRIREENNEFAEQVASLEAVVGCETQVADKDFVFVTEMLMRQLLKLDGIDAQGEGRTQRKLEVRRLQGLVDKLDKLKADNSNISTDIIKTASSEPSMPSPKVTQEWEVFE
ncbi:BAG family molecular chaperone regulator 4-like isoform X2 [Rutidosis leptorrhynchoides]|uniref:BAG family molecular chaperone regulator 4-like isoform X2 n=1 Tax=Rutidosis leptorrhynchoides TaxID=125765 RepID=UPI003A9A1099